MKNLKKSLRTSLVEVKKRKEDRLIESKILESRITLLSESLPDMKKFKKLPLNKKLEVGLPIIQEASYLRDMAEQKNLLNEQGLMELLGKVFGTTASAGTETVFEAILRSVLKKIGLDGFLTDAIVFFFSRNPGKIWESLTNCRTFSQNVGKAIMEAYIVKLQKDYQMQGIGYDAIRNVLMKVLEDSNFGDKLGDAIADKICNLFSSALDKGKQLVGNITNPTPPTAVATN